ncbi:unnamed protein product [Adineta ricciae]|uniref:Protein kinase domain-containing protein n=1 Tax=Adineta ricciae TaxID=249248 RepID=A0A813U0E2_ADIRI|nr:unnamed protein product [Adineta ricciae]
MHTLEQLKTGQLVGVQRLRLSCELTTFPIQIFDLADTLEILDLSNNHLSHLPDDFKRLQKLKIAFFANNQFTELPAVLSQCPHIEIASFKSNCISTIPEHFFSPTLRWLILTNNRITTIPSTIGQCTRLQKLMLAGNLLSQLPASMTQCTNLELLRLSANQFVSLPSWLYRLPKLAWLAFSSNSCCKKMEPSSDLVEIPCNQLTVTEQLGEGASGVISKALWKHDSIQQVVAVKIFRGQMTSDGLPEDEMNSCMAAGTHENLVKLLGRTTDDSTQERSGLVFELVPASFKVLGNPPSFETCTRDIYPPETTFTLSQVIQIVSGIASAMSHLHGRGIMHGDLYAHNILVDATSVLLSDYGAATAYRKEDSNDAAVIERVEVRAFGCLMEDLLDRVNRNETNEALKRTLNVLKEDCMRLEVLERPTFKDICKRIAHFQSST